MTVLCVPKDPERYPTLGPYVVEWMEANLVFGPGDLRGEPYSLDAEQQGFIYRFYEIFPRGHPEEGRRRFTHCGLSIAKGLRKTELGSAISAAELSPDAPVRFNGWNKDGTPNEGKPVTDPVCLLVAATEEQSDDLAYGTLRVMLGEGPIAHLFDIGLERILRINGDGKAMSLAGSPSARDGGRTTFALLDETHWWTLPRMKQAKQTIIANLGKRKLAQPWALEVTTAFEPGAGSVAEGTYETAKAIAEGRSHEARLYFYHREASDKHDLTTEEGARAAVIEASGPAASWRDVEGIMAQWRDPTTDPAWWERVWTNRRRHSSIKAFDPAKWAQLARPDYTIPDGALVVMGFDGARFTDSTALIVAEVETGFQHVMEIWEKPYGPTGDGWQVPESEVEDMVFACFQKWNVWRMYCDPPYWQEYVAKWAGQFGADRVVEWWTNRRSQMTRALEAFQTALQTGTISHDGSPVLAHHLANAYRKNLPQLDEQGQPLYLIQKERSDSPNKIDGIMATILSNEARNDAIQAGVTSTAWTWGAS